MRILLLNQFVPPDASPTARLLGELRETLENAGHETVLIGIPDGYRKTGSRFRTRFARDLLTLGKLLFRGMTARKVDAVIAFSSPPCLVTVASLIAFRHRAKLIHWCMDLYPDLVVALGVIGRDHPIYRLIKSFTTRAIRRCDLVVALDEDMAERFRNIGVTPEILAPWPPSIRIVNPANRSAEKLPDSQAFTWLYSGNLGRAHEWETPLDAQAILEREPAERDIELVFQGGGAAREEAREHAESLGLTRCRWRGYLDDDQFMDSLLSADALVVTQRPEVRGMLWPSKIALATLVTRPLIWVGDSRGAIADSLADKPDTCIADPGEAAKIAAFLRERTRAAPNTAVPDQSLAEFQTAVDAVRLRGMEQWRAWVDERLA